MALRNLIKNIPLSVYDAADLAGHYDRVNPEGLPESCFMIIITNGSDKNIFVSTDGIIDHEYILAGQASPLKGIDFFTENGYRCQWRKQTIYYIRSLEGAGEGTITLSGYYQPVD